MNSYLYYSMSTDVSLRDTYIDNVLADLIFLLHIHKPATFNWNVYARPGKCGVMFLCAMISFYDFFFYWISELFLRQCVIFCFSFCHISVKYLYYWMHNFMIAFLISWIPKYQNNVIIIWWFFNQKKKKNIILCWILNRCVSLHSKN